MSISDNSIPGSYSAPLQGGAPLNYKWVIVPLTIDMSPTKTIVKWDLCSPTERVHELGLWGTLHDDGPIQAGTCMLEGSSSGSVACEGSPSTTA